MVVRISVSITFRDKDFLDKLVEDGKHQTRSEAIRHAIRLLRDYNEGKFYASTTASYTYKPVLSRITIQAQGYFLPDTDDAGELQRTMMQELKAKQIELGLREEEPLQEIDCGFDSVDFDPAKCKYPILKNGKITQCPNYKEDLEDYCYEHLK